MPFSRHTTDDSHTRFANIISFQTPNHPYEKRILLGYRRCARWNADTRSQYQHSPQAQCSFSLYRQNIFHRSFTVLNDWFVLIPMWCWLSRIMSFTVFHPSKSNFFFFRRGVLLLRGSKYAPKLLACIDE